MFKGSAHYRSADLLKYTESPVATTQLKGSYYRSRENYPPINSQIDESNRWKGYLLPEVDEKYRQLLSNPNQISRNTGISRTRGEIIQQSTKIAEGQVNEDVISGYEQKIEQLEFLATSLKEENDYLRAKLLEQFNIQVKNIP